MSVLEPILNALWFLTLWLSVPVALARVLGPRVADQQRSMLRVTLAGVPVVLAVAFWGTPFEGVPLIPIAAISAPAEPDRGGGPEPTATPRASASVMGFDEPGWRSPAAADRLDFSEVPRDSNVARDSLALEVGEKLSQERHDILDQERGMVPAPSTTNLGWLVPGAVALWVLLALAGLVRLGRSLQALRALGRGWKAIRGYGLEHARALARSIGYYHDFGLFSSVELREAVASGFLRPAITLPNSWITELGGEELDPLVLHEIAHLRSRDPLWRALAWVATILLWPHPLMHWLGRREQVLSEYAADERVLRAGASKRSYARLLGRIAEQQMGLTASPITAGILGNRNHLEGRIRMILSSSVPRRGGRGWTSRAFLSLGGALALSLIVTHPLIGTCDPCPPKPVPPTETDLERFVLDENASPDGRVRDLLRLAVLDANDGRTDEPGIAAAQGDLEKARKLLRRRLQTPQKRLDATEARFEEARRRLERFRKLHDEGLTTRDDLDKLEMDLDRHDTAVAEANHTIAAMLAEEAEWNRARGNYAKAFQVFEEALARGEIERAHAAALRAFAEMARRQDASAREAGDAGRAERSYLEALAALGRARLRQGQDLLVDDLNTRITAQRAAAMRQDQLAKMQVANQRAQELEMLLARARLDSGAAGDQAERAFELLSLVAEKRGNINEHDLEQITGFLRSAHGKDYNREQPPRERWRSAPEIQAVEQMREMFDTLKHELMDMRKQLEQERDQFRMQLEEERVQFRKELETFKRLRDKGHDRLK